MKSLYEVLKSRVEPRSHRRSRPYRYEPKFERLESRQMLAVSAVFSAATGALNVYGDGAGNAIEVSRTSGGGILINGGAVGVVGGSPTVSNTTLIRVFGLGGDDSLSVNEANGSLPMTQLYGGSGNDILVGGSAADLVFGQSGEDTLLGRGGADMIFGGSGDDVLTGGTGDDFAYGQSNSDRFIWNPGDGADLNEGGADIDTVEVNGSDSDETFTTTANGTRVRFDRLHTMQFAIDIGTVEHLTVKMNGGQDSFSATGNLAALIQITVDGGAGNDTILGSNGTDTLLGGDGDDFIDGQQGNDLLFGGNDNDTFQWDPGDGSDTIEGQGGTDTLLFNGSNGSEIMEIIAVGSRVRFTRNLGNIVMDLDDVEEFDVNLLGSADSMIVNDLTGTDVTVINISLASLIGGATGDGQADNVQVRGTSGEDVIFVTGSSSGVTVSGLAALINILAAESASDRLTIFGLGGDDIIDASGLAASGIAITLDGGDDDDVLTGGDGADTLLGGLGDDALFGGPGLDILDGGPGDNVVIQ